MIRPKRRVRRGARGGYEIRLPPEERSLLQQLPAQLEAALSSLLKAAGPVPDELRRLLPPAYLADQAAEESYVRLARDGLIEHHLQSLTLLSSTADAEHLDDEQADGWLYAVNDLRLALGSGLGVSEEPVEVRADDPHYGDWVCYQYLSFLQGEILEAMSGALAEPMAQDSDLPDDPWGDPPGGLRWDGTPRPERP